MGGLLLPICLRDGANVSDVSGADCSRLRLSMCCKVLLVKLLDYELRSSLLARWVVVARAMPTACYHVFSSPQVTSLPQCVLVAPGAQPQQQDKQHEAKAAALISLHLL